MCIRYIYIYIYIQVKLGTVVKGDPKVPFSIGGVEGDAIPFPGLLLFTLDTYFKMLNVKQGNIKYHLLSF